MPSKIDAPLRVAIIRNFSNNGPWAKIMLDDITRLVQQSAHNATVDSYGRIDGDPLPDPTKLDLIILTGGLYDLTIQEPIAWVAETLSWLRNTIELANAPKIVGICWGHQLVCRALGGKIVTSSDGHRVSKPQEHQAMLPDTDPLLIDRNSRCTSNRRRSSVFQGFRDGGECSILSAHPMPTQWMVADPFAFVPRLIS